VEAQWLMLQQAEPEDFVIATGQQYSVRDFVNAAAKEIGMELTWKGKRVHEHAFDAQGNCVVRVDPRYFRPTEVETLLGDPTKAREKLGWKAKVSFAELVSEMMVADLAEAERDDLVRRHGYLAPNRQE
jgi:GDPmannose 4,6-dehydratase